MSYQIREASLQDAAAILMLIQELAVFEKEPEAVIITQEDIELHGFGRSPLFQCLVAELEGIVVGMALYYPRYSTWKGPTFHLEDLIVTENQKGKGIGTSLYHSFIEKAYAAKVNRIEWVVLDWNTPAVQFYKNSGATVLEDWNTVQMDREAMADYIKRKKNKDPE